MLSGGMASTGNLHHSCAARVVWMYAATGLEQMVPRKSVSRDPKKCSQLYCIFQGLQLADSSDLLGFMADSLRAKL